MFVFGKASEEHLATTKPAMQALARAALACSEVDFGIVQGNRTPDEQMRLYGKGRTRAECEAAGVPVDYAQPGEKQVTWTLKSNHIGGNSIDVCPFVDGAFCWDDDGALGLWPKIVDAFHRAAQKLNTVVYWGGEWKSRDTGRIVPWLIPAARPGPPAG